MYRFASIMVAAIFFSLVEIASGAVFVNVGTHNVAEGTPTVVIPFVISNDGGEQMQGVTFRVEITDGSVDANDPTILSFDDSSSPFAGAAFKLAPNPALPSAHTEIGSGVLGAPVAATGTLFELTIDTSSAPVGSYAINVVNVGLLAGFSTEYDPGTGPVAISGTNGTLNIVAVPTPSAIALGTLALGVLGIRRRIA